jgi:hypothetical protein
MRLLAAALLAVILATPAVAESVDELEKEIRGLEARLKELGRATLESRFHRNEAQRLHVLDVADLTVRLTDFIRPNITMTPAGAEFDEDAPMFGTVREGPTFFDPEELVELIRSNVRPAVWEADGTIEVQGRAILVSAPEEVIRDVRAALGTLRSDVGRMVTVELRVVRAGLEELPIGTLTREEFDGLLVRLREAGDDRIVASTELTGYAGQRMMLFDGRQVAYVQDHDVEVAQDARIADPIVSVLQDGVSFDVRAMPMGSDGRILLDFRADFGATVGEIPLLRTEVGLTQLPRQRYARAHAAVTVPNGGGLVLGGTTRDGNLGARVAFLVRARAIGVRAPAHADEVDRESTLRRRADSLRRLVKAHQEAVRAEGPPFHMRLYPVEDLTFRPTDRPGTKLGLRVSGAGGFGDDDEDFEESPEFFEPDQLVEMIRSHVAPGSWEELLSTSINYTNRNIVVVHTLGVHAHIREFLRSLRERTSHLLSVDVEVVAVSDADRHALGSTEGHHLLLPEARKRLMAWIEEGRASRLHAGRILARGQQRVALVDLEPQAYVYDYDVEIAEKASISDPLISHIQQGLVVDVRPTVAGRGGVVVLECRMSRAAQAPGPIPQVDTDVGSIETPVLRFTKLGSTVAVPEGKTMVLGGGLRPVGGEGDSVLLLVTPRIVK